MTDPQQPEAPPRLPEETALLHLLSRLADQAARPLGTEAIKAAIRSAELSVRASEDPWAWLTESAERVGFRVCRVDRSWEEAEELLAKGPLVTRAGGWLLLEDDGPDLVARRPGESDAPPRLDPEALHRELSLATGDPLPLAVVQPLAPATPAAPSEDPVSPARRLFQLVAPDRRDLKTVVVFAGVVGLLNLATPVAVEALVNTVAFVGLLQPIVILALVLAGCLGFAAVVRALEAYVVELLQRRVFARVATDLAYRLPRVRRDALDRVHGPELVNRFFDITTVQKVGSKLLLDGVTVVLSAAIGLLVLAFYHPLLLAFDVVLLASLVVIVFVMGRGAVKTAIKESSAKYAVADWLEELVRHPLAFHLAGGRAIALDHADTLTNSYLEKRARHYRIVLRQLVSALALQVVTSALLLGLGGWLVKIGQLTLGQLVASWLIVSLVLAAVAKLGRQLEAVYDLLAAADKLGVLFDLPLEGEDGEEPLSLASPAAIHLREVTHRWPNGTASFTQASLEIAPGEQVAICAPSGAGKTTLLELIQGQRPCSGGRIEFDGVDLRSLRPSALRPQVALVRPGEVIATSVAENVRLGRNLSLDEVRRALDAAGIWDAIQRLPGGVDAQLTSFGRPLSEGQADQLALARGIASSPRLLLIDGVLDGLDEPTLDHVFPHLSGGPWTLVVATRRAEIARRCSRQVTLSLRGVEELSS